MRSPTHFISLYVLVALHGTRQILKSHYERRRRGFLAQWAIQCFHTKTTALQTATNTSARVTKAGPERSYCLAGLNPRVQTQILRKDKRRGKRNLEPKGVGSIPFRGGGRLSGGGEKRKRSNVISAHVKDPRRWKLKAMEIIHY